MISLIVYNTRNFTYVRVCKIHTRDMYFEEEEEEEWVQEIDGDGKKGIEISLANCSYGIGGKIYYLIALNVDVGCSYFTGLA